MRKFKYIFDIRVMIGIVAILSFSLYIFSGATLNFYQNPSKEIVVIGNYQFSRYPIVELEDRSKNISLEVSVYDTPLFDQYISNAQLVSLYGSNIEAVNTLSDKDKYYIDKLITPEVYSSLSYDKDHKQWLDRIVDLLNN